MKTYITQQAAHEAIPAISAGYMLNGWDIPKFQIVPSCGRFFIRIITARSVFTW